MLKKTGLNLTLLSALMAPNALLANDLMNALQLALTNDPDLIAAKHLKQADQENKPQALAKLFPTLKLHSSVGKAYQDVQGTWLRPAEGNNPLLGSSIHNDIRVTLGLTQPILNLPHLKNLKISETQFTRAELNYGITLQQMLLRVAERYFGVLSATDSLTFIRSQKKAIARQLQQAKHRYEIGLIPAANVHESQAKHDLTLAKEMQAEIVLADQKELLRRLTGNEVVTISTLKNNTPLAPPSPPNVDDWIEFAKSANLEIAETKLQTDILRLEKEAIRAENYPTIDLKAQYGYNEHGGAYRSLTLDGLVALSFNMTIFEGNASSSRIAQKQALLARSVALAEKKEREVLHKTRMAYLGVLTGMTYVKALAQALKSSNQAFISTQAGFDVGTRSAAEVLEAQRMLFRSQKDLSHARYSYILSTLKLKGVVGLLTVDDLKQVNSWLD